MKNFMTLVVLLLIGHNVTSAQTYPMSKQLVFDEMPELSKPNYLQPIKDPVYRTNVIRITDKDFFENNRDGLKPYHHYAKDQPWNSDGSLISLTGSPAALLDGQTFEFLKSIDPPTGPHVWSNTEPYIILGTNGSNQLIRFNVKTEEQIPIKTFSDFDLVSLGEWEGNLSNDDRYTVLQCSTSVNKTIVAFDLVQNKIISSMNAPIWPNNCSMTQSGDYVVVQWGDYGVGPYEGVWVYNRLDMNPIRRLSTCGGCHYDFGFDTDGNEVVVGPDYDGDSRGISMIRIDNGKKTFLLGDQKMSWYIHVSCRNIKRPGWAYVSEFANENSERLKPNFQKIFAVKLDPNAQNNAETETFAHAHHSDYVAYKFSPFAVPNRDGSQVMFRSDWMGGKPDSEINSYVAFKSD